MILKLFAFDFQTLIHDVQQVLVFKRCSNSLLISELFVYYKSHH